MTGVRQGSVYDLRYIKCINNATVTFCNFLTTMKSKLYYHGIC